MGLVGLLCDLPWSNTIDQSKMNFVEVTSLLLPAVLLLVLFIRMKILTGRQVILQSYDSKDILMQEQHTAYEPGNKLPFTNFSIRSFMLWSLLALVIIILSIQALINSSFL